MARIYTPQRGRVDRPAVVPGYEYEDDEDLDDETRAVLDRRVPHPYQDVKGKTVRKRFGRARNGEFDPDMQVSP